MIISQKKKLGFRKDKLQQFYEIEVASMKSFHTFLFP